MLITADAERRYIGAIFGALGSTPPEAEAVAEVLTEADLRGHTSHGLVRVTLNANLLKTGAAQSGARPRVLEENGPTAHLDGDRALGPYAALAATREAIRRAGERGVGVVALHNCGHIGLAGYYVEQAARQDLIGVLFAKSALHIHPHGGTERRIGTNPISIAIPTAGEPFLLDMSTSGMANGKLQEAARDNRPIPEGMALDSEGRPTTDASAAVAGALSAVGGAKGYGLALAVELLGGLLPGAGAGEMRAPDGTRRLWGALIFVLDPASLGDVAQFKQDASAYLEDVKSSRKAPGFSEILVPGERSFRTRQEQSVSGVLIEDEVWQQVAEIARNAGVDAEEFAAAPPASAR
jgi:LDH2 family malate/lactate/ureidoglycolate dehydrogenase